MKIVVKFKEVLNGETLWYRGMDYIKIRPLNIPETNIRFNCIHTLYNMLKILNFSDDTLVEIENPSSNIVRFEEVPIKSKFIWNGVKYEKTDLCMIRSNDDYYINAVIPDKKIAVYIDDDEMVEIINNE